MSEKAGNSRALVIGLTVMVLLVAFFVPRVIIGHLGTSDPWACYLFQYILGFVTFGIGLLIVVRSGACKFGRGRDSYWFKWLVGGFLLLATIHALWILFALSTPVRGGV